MDKKSYWNNNSKYQAISEALEALVPASGEVANAATNPALEAFRVAGNAYYDIFNNGGCNRKQAIKSIFGISLSKFKESPRGWLNFDAIADIVEPIMDSLVIAAAIEQNLITISLKITGE